MSVDTIPLTDKRAQLMARKMEIDDQLARAKIDLDEVKAMAAAKRRFLPIGEFAEMRRTVAHLQRESQRLQFELRGDRKAAHAAKDQRTTVFLQEFFLVARRSLSKEQYASMCREAEANLSRQFGERAKP